MKKFFLNIIFALAVCFILTSVCYSAGIGDIGTNLQSTGTSAGYSSTTDIRIIIANIIKVALGFLGIIFVVLVIYAGFLWMTAQGDKTKITKAKDLIINGVIGLIIVVSAYAITTFVVNAIVSSTGGTPSTAPETKD